MTVRLLAETNQGAFRRGESVILSYRVAEAPAETVPVEGFYVRIEGWTKPDFRREMTIDADMRQHAGEPLSGAATIWTVPEDAEEGAYAVDVAPLAKGGAAAGAVCRTFFRVVGENDLLTYRIRKIDYGGYPIFLLDGGMSAEYAVVKAGEALAATVSPSWVTKAPGHGPRECVATPDFLLKSIEATVAFYDEHFGADAVYDTVFISTGVSSMAYMARTFRAPILPLQFLVSVDTAAELALVLEHARRHGIEAYSTLGHDTSVDMAVAWVKLLSLPPAYRDFLIRHRVRTVLFMGASGLTGGENRARKLLRPGADAERVRHGDIFVLHPYGGIEFDERELRRKVKDFASLPLEPGFRNISDWESGVIPEQIQALGAAIREAKAASELHFVTAETYLELYNLATYATLAFYKKNESLLRGDGSGSPVKGLVLNPYLISHPHYETTQGLVPFVFFQGEAVERRIGLTVREAIRHYFPEVRLEDLPATVNTTRNFGGFALERVMEALRMLGIRQIDHADPTVDEVWDPSDGMNAPAEKIAEKLRLSGVPYEEAKRRDKRLKCLQVEDLREIAAAFPGIRVLPVDAPSVESAIFPL